MASDGNLTGSATLIGPLEQWWYKHLLSARVLQLEYKNTVNSLFY